MSKSRCLHQNPMVKTTIYRLTCLTSHQSTSAEISNIVQLCHLQNIINPCCADGRCQMLNDFYMNLFLFVNYSFCFVYVTHREITDGARQMSPRFSKQFLFLHLHVFRVFKGLWPIRLLHFWVHQIHNLKPQTHHDLSLGLLQQQGF